MDFASLMKSHIAASTIPGDSSDGGGKKYLKRSELEAQRQAAYEREQAAQESARAERAEKKRKREAEEAEREARLEEKRRRLAIEGKRMREAEEREEEAKRRKRLGLPELPSAGPEKKEEEVVAAGEEDIEDEVLKAKLRDMGEPRTVFGETHIQRLRRYRKLTATPVTMSSGPIPTSLALLPERDIAVPAQVPTDAEGRTLLRRQLASYFDLVLTEWDLALSRRPADVQASFAGRQARQHYTLARTNLIPLFRQLETDTLSPALLTAVHEIVLHAQKRRYVAANDAYLRLSIGKAAWPIGVTMVGIHERSAREKLHEAEKGKDGGVAHILADEGTRKMLQGIKRCLSFAQTRWVPEDGGQIMG
ncbi:hypothetical protein M433DRAFT_63637 [Acidomyces richmondensis BFW]|nr:MAG: hypothetical protein FE78DRAFT_70784 [Acidomyces sp. 'richmondensis']KYG47199.1 hypothetical protein M433DRAFT_63637 [Acidomyces richmondensis BFW]